MNASDYIDDQLDAAPVSASDYLDQQLGSTPLTGNAGDYSKTRGFIEGLRAPLDASAQMLTHALPDKVVKGANDLMGSFSPTTSQLDSQISQRSNQYNADRSAAGQSGIDWPYMAGNVVGTAPLAAALLEGEGLSLAGKVVNVLGQGGLFGSMTPVTQDQNDFWGQKGGQAALGAATNGVIAPVASAASSIISPNVSDAVKTLMGEGVTPTAGQILGGGWKSAEDKMSSIPVLGDMIKNSQARAANQLNVAVANRALAPIGETATSTAGRDLVDEVSTKLGNAYDTLLPNLTFTADPQFTSEVQKISGMAKFLPEQQAKQFDNVVGNQLNKIAQTGTNSVDGETLKGIQSELTSQAKGYMSDPSYDNRKLGQAINEVNNSIRSSLQRTNPQYADQLSAINTGYANYAILRKAGTNLGQAAEPGVFSPSQLQSAVKASDNSVAKGNFAKGKSLMQDLSDPALQVLGGKYPDSGTAGRELHALLAAGLLEGGGAYFDHPLIPLGIGAGAIPYTDLGQKAVGAALTQRPAFAKPLGNLVKKSAPYAATGVAGLANQNVPFSLNGGFQ